MTYKKVKTWDKTYYYVYMTIEGIETNIGYISKYNEDDVKSPNNEHYWALWEFFHNGRLEGECDSWDLDIYEYKDDNIDFVLKYFNEKIVDYIEFKKDYFNRLFSNLSLTKNAEVIYE